DAILRIIQIETDGLRGHALAPLGVIRKELSKMEVADIFMMPFKGLPCFPLSERRDLCCHICTPCSRSDTKRGSVSCGFLVSGCGFQVSGASPGLKPDT